MEIQKLTGAISNIERSIEAARKAAEEKELALQKERVRVEHLEDHLAKQREALRGKTDAEFLAENQAEQAKPESLLQTIASMPAGLHKQLASSGGADA